MELNKIIKLILNGLEEEIKNTNAFKILLDRFINITEEKQNIEVFVSHAICEKEKHLYDYVDNVKKDEFNGLIFSLESLDNDEITLSLYFSDNTYKLLYVESIEKGELINDVEIDVVFNKNSTTWLITESVVDIEEYIFDYKYNILCFNKNNELIELPNIEEEKDKNFSEIFGVPIEKARYYRQNFKANCNLLNYSKLQKTINKENEIFNNQKYFFTMPFKMTEFKNFVLNGAFYDDDEEIDEEIDDDEIDEYYDSISEEEYMDEEVEDEYNETADKLLNIKEMLVKYTGTTGDFIMTYNLYLNLISFVNNSEHLTIDGLLIRKLNDIYTAFYLHLSHNEIIIIPKNLKREELEKLYYSHDDNKEVYGLYEFFEIGKKYTLGPNNNETIK